MNKLRHPRRWEEVDASVLRDCVGVMTDVDDTLTRDGAIEPQALGALHALHQAQVPVVAVTGRPKGWSEPFARDWPVAAIVAENGAVALRRSSDGRDGLRVDYLQDASLRDHNARRLREVAQRILREVPGSTLAQDSAGRVTDIAVDHSEFTHLSADAIAKVVAVMRDEGMRATVSSIHINGWFGDHDKWQGARWIVSMLYGRVLEDESSRWLFVGDSTNDQVMFEHFKHAVGVANLRQFADQLKVWPAYLSDHERGAGFADVAHALLRARRG